MKFFSNKKLSIKYILMCTLLAAGLLVTGCSNNSNVQNTDSSVVESKVETTSQALVDFASHLSLDEKELGNVLTITEDDKEYKLLPATESEEDLNYWKGLTTKDKEYIQTFFQNREPLTESSATSQFNKTMRSMWKTKKPDSMLFIVLLNGNYAGIINCAGLKGTTGVTIGYVTAKEYSGQGVATNALKMFIQFVKHLNEKSSYKVPKAMLYIFDDNAASIRVSEKNGFTFVEDDEKTKISKYELKL